MRYASLALLIVALVSVATSAAVAADGPEPPTVEPLVRTVDLNRGEQQAVKLPDGTIVNVKLIDVQERRDTVRGALRAATVTVEVDGEPVTLTSCTYHLPKTVGRVQIDCPVTKGYVQKKSNPWALDRAARLRLWPKGSPWIRPGTFGYPVEQCWFADQTQMSNQLADAERVENKKFYYHWGLDFGGADKLVPVVAATDGLVVSTGGKRLKGERLPSIVKPRYDVVYLRDDRGWYYRYSHLDSIDPAIKLGQLVKLGQPLGMLGKRGASGGWAHLHFDVGRPMPSGRYGIDDAYAFAWQAYQREHPTPLVAVARPHELAYVGQPVTLDASRSWSVLGPEAMKYEWTFDDGTTATGPKVIRQFDRPGNYSETVKVTDSAGRVAYDFARVFVFSREAPRKRPPVVHVTHWPTRGIKPGDEVTFKAITREVRLGEGQETWDFGDGSPTATTQSQFEWPSRANKKTYETAAVYATTKHAYAKPGDYVVTVRRTNDRGETGTAKLVVHVEP